MALSQIAFDFFDEPSLPPKKEVKKTVPVKVDKKPIVVYKEEKIKSARGRMSVKDMEATVDLIDVPDDDVLFEKSYYAIGKVAAMFKVNQSLIRFWENEFDVLKPKKNGKGDRLFRPEDVKNLKLIYTLIRERKYTIEGAKDFIKKSKKLDEKFALIESMKKLKGFLLELKANI
ncbi:MAG: MerR family transcriptional regulator [Ferruginibacter sp.]|nr:MerR family transcriptional regulator [Ferruginibacter sp.]